MKKLLAKWLIGDITEKYETKANFDDVLKELYNSVKNNNFSVVSEHNMRETYKKNKLEVADDFEYRIVQICNAPKSHKALSQMSFEMGVMMPKSIIIARENGKTTLRFMKMKPWMVSMMFPDLDIAPMSKMVTGIMSKIVKETLEKV